MNMLQALRAKFPQYNDMSDDELAGAFHQKFYADMPRDEFNAKIGVAPKQQTEVRSYEPTIREKIGGYISDFFGNSAEGDRLAQGVVGSSGLGHSSIAVTDFTPARIPMFAQEAKRAYDEGRPGEAALSALGATPVPVLNKAVEGVAAAAQPAVQAAGQLGTQVAARLPARVTGRSADDVADKVIAGRLQRSGQSADTVAADLAAGQRSARLGSNSQAELPEMLADTSDDMQRLTGSVYRTGGEASEIVKPRLEARQRGPENFYADRIDDAPMGQMERIVDDFDRSLGVKSEKGARATAAQLEAQQKARADQLYTKARAESEEFDLEPALADMQARAMQYEPGDFRTKLQTALSLFDPRVRMGADLREAAARQLRQADDMLAAKLRDGGKITEKDMQARANLEENVQMALDNALKRQVPKSSLGVNNVTKFDNSKKVLDDMIDSAKRTGDANLARELKIFKDSLLNQVHAGGKNKYYKQARDEFGTAAENREAIDLGRKAFREDSEVSVDTYRSLTPAQQKLFRIGLRDALRLALATKKPGDNATLLLQQRRVRELLNEVIPTPRGKDAEFADRAVRFGDLMRREERMSQTRDKVLGGSPTAQRTGDDAEFASDTLARFVSSGRSVLNMGLELVGNQLQKVFGYRRDVAAALARKLTSTDPAERKAALDAIRAAQSPQAFSAFAEGISKATPRTPVIAAPTSQEDRSGYADGGAVMGDLPRISKDPYDQIPVTADGDEEKAKAAQARMYNDNMRRVKDRSLVTYGDKQVIPNNIDDTLEMLGTGLQRAGEVGAAFPGVGTLIDDAGAALGAGLRTLRSKPAAPVEIIPGASKEGDAILGAERAKREAAQAADRAVREEAAKKARGAAYQAEAAKKGSTGTVPALSPTKDRAAIIRGLPEGTAPMAIKGRQGMPTREEQISLVDKYLSGGGRARDLPAGEGPWGASPKLEADRAREAIQRGYDQGKAKPQSTGPKANMPGVPDIMKAWKTAKADADALRGQLKALQEQKKLSPHRPYTPRWPDGTPIQIGSAAPDDALKAELRKVQKDLGELHKMVRDAGGDVSKEITPREPPRVFRTGQ